MTLSRKEMVKKAALDVLKAFIIGVAAAAAAAKMQHLSSEQLSLNQLR